MFHSSTDLRRVLHPSCDLTFCTVITQTRRSTMNQEITDQDIEAQLVESRVLLEKMRGTHELVVNHAWPKEAEQVWDAELSKKRMRERQ